MVTLYKRDRSPYYYARLDDGRRVSTGERDRRKAVQAAEKQQDSTLKTTGDSLRLLQAAARFFNTKKLRPKTVESYKAALASFYGKLGDFPLHLLDRRVLRTYVDARLRETSSIMVRRELAFMSSLYATATHWENGPESNPARDYPKRGLADARPRNRWLTPDEVQRLLDACLDDEHRAMLIVLVHTGMRSGEMRNLKWSQVSFERNEIILYGHDTKTHDYRIIPMSPLVHSTLSTHSAVCHGEYVFGHPVMGRPYSSIKTFWSGVCRRSGLRGIRIHDLRHTFASWLLQKGVAQITVQDLLGHKSASMTKRYAKTSSESLQTAVSGALRDTLLDTQATDCVSPRNRVE